MIDELAARGGAVASVWVLCWCLRYPEYFLGAVAGVRCVQVRGYMISLGSRYGSRALLWINVPVTHHIHSGPYAGAGREGDSERGLGMDSVFPGGCQ